MICHDCRPIRDAVQLCDRHVQMEHNQAVVEAMIASGDMADRQERRYALLQATAIIYAGQLAYDGSTGAVNGDIDKAEQMLAEIQKREPEKKP